MLFFTFYDRTCSYTKVHTIYILGVFIYFWYVATNKFSWHWFTSLKSHNCHDFSLHHELVFDDMNLHMVYIWSSLLQLTVEPCDLCQADNLFTAVTSWINSLLSLKMTNFHPVSFWVVIFVIDYVIQHSTKTKYQQQQNGIVRDFFCNLYGVPVCQSCLIMSCHLQQQHQVHFFCTVEKLLGSQGYVLIPPQKELHQTVLFSVNLKWVDGF